MEKHINILTQLLRYWWDQDDQWDELNEGIKYNVFSIFLYDKSYDMDLTRLDKADFDIP